MNDPTLDEMAEFVATELFGVKEQPCKPPCRMYGCSIYGCAERRAAIIARSKSLLSWSGAGEIVEAMRERGWQWTGSRNYPTGYISHYFNNGPNDYAEAGETFPEANLRAAHATLIAEKRQ